MPGPVSDSYDPEFGTGANAADVAEAVRALVARVTKELGADANERTDYRNIVEVIHGARGRGYTLDFSARELRVLRFALSRALEDI